MLLQFNQLGLKDRSNDSTGQRANALQFNQLGLKDV